LSNGDNNGDGVKGTAYVTVMSFGQYQKSQETLCAAYRSGVLLEIKALKNLFIASITLSTAIISIWMYIVNMRLV